MISFYQHQRTYASEIPYVLHFRTLWLTLDPDCVRTLWSAPKTDHEKGSGLVQTINLALVCDQTARSICVTFSLTVSAAWLEVMSAVAVWQTSVWSR